MTRSIERFIQGIPKAELHLHIEGTLEPELMFELARRNGVALRFKSVAEVRAAYEFTDLQSFLDIYYEAARVLLHERDFRDLGMAYLDRAAAQNIRRAEIFFDPQTHTDRGVPFAAVLGGLRGAIDEAKTRFGVSAGLILCFLRHLSAASAMKTLEEALPFKDQLLGVGLDSGEKGNPPSKFAAVFRRARAEGLRAVAHAGEEGPPSYIREALDLLHARRIEHGVRCEEDPDLLERLRAERIPLTMCPLSNVKLRVIDRLENHNLKRLLEAGLCVTVNSDDPAYFGGYLVDNLLAVQAALSLGTDDIRRLAANGFEASFLEPDEKRRLIAEAEGFRI